MPIEPVDLDSEAISNKKSPSSVMVMMELIKAVKELTEEVKTLSDRVEAIEQKVNQPQYQQPFRVGGTGTNIGGGQIYNDPYRDILRYTQAPPTTWITTTATTNDNGEGIYTLNVPAESLTDAGVTSRTVSYTATTPPTPEVNTDREREVFTQDFGRVLERLNFVENQYENSIMDDLADILDPNS